MDETTGMRPAAIRSVIASVLTLWTSPTSPMSVGTPSTITLRRAAVNSFPSSPVVPTAYGPCVLISFTNSRPTWPNSTIRATSSTSGVVTRNPPLNSLVIPSRLSIALICGPPPWTTTGCTPQLRRKTNVGGERVPQGFVDHRVAAALDDDDLFVQVLEPRQRLGQQLCPDGTGN